MVHIEICEDFWIPVPPSSLAALAGATVLLNLSGSPITIGKADTRRLLCQSQSVRCLAAYLYAAAGEGESTTDVSWDGQATMFENGVKLAETERFPTGDRIAVADIDLDLLRQERMRMATFDDNRRAMALGEYRRVSFRVDPPEGDIGFERTVERFPFVPADPARLEQDCYEAYNIQVSGLMQRLARRAYQAGGDRRFRRAGFDAGADCHGAGVRPAGAPAHRHYGVHHAGLRDRRRDEGERTVG